MSDTATGSKTVKSAKAKGAGPGWNTSADGASVSKAFSFGSPAEGAKFARRAVQMAERGGQSVDVGFGGKTVTVGLKTEAGTVGDGERRLARRLDGKRTDEEKAARAARIAAKAAKPPRAPKAPKS